jgi:predicted GNAT superfamily acetyltransferase
LALPACRALAEQQLGFAAADQIPEWFMHTTDRFGGLTLGAFADGRLVGYSYALPGYDGRPFLLSCGLVVAAEFESRGIGLSLKLAQARHARAAGYELARWTTNALASRPLRVYLSKLGARLVRYHAEMYAGVQATAFPDEVEIEWDLRRESPRRQAREAQVPPSLTATREVRPGLRRLVHVDADLGSPPGSSYSVEIPWDRGTIERAAPELAQGWLAGVRSAMRALLERGYVGTGVLADGSQRRSFVKFERDPSAAP